jgi:hypothetical protein
MKRSATQTWVGVVLAGLLAIGTTASTGAETPTPESQVGDVPMCRIEADGRERTKLVPPHKTQDKLDKNLQPGECPNPVNGRVMCKIKDGSNIKNVLVKDKEVKEMLGRGWTLGACDPPVPGRGSRRKGAGARKRSNP